MKPIIEQNVIDWLMEGDPAIRWQVMRDLLGKPAAQWRREQRRTEKEGWGKQLLDLRDPAGTWSGGIYGPKWTSTNYTLLLLRDMGLPRDHRAAAESATIIIDREMRPFGRWTAEKLLDHLDLCLPGMYLALLAYFDVRDERVSQILGRILREQMKDGGWNCKRKLHNTDHSSLHTTINILDGLADYAEYGGSEATVAPAMRRAEEFILQHRLYRSDKTGEVIHPSFTKFSFPPRWHWDVLRGLDYFRRVNATRDERLQDAINLLISKRSPDGRWKLENNHKGKEFFRLEKPGQPSRWNTMRALRVLRWWGDST